MLSIIVNFDELGDDIEDVPVKFSLLFFAQLVIVILSNLCPLTFLSFSPRLFWLLAAISFTLRIVIFRLFLRPDRCKHIF